MANHGKRKNELNQKIAEIVVKSPAITDRELGSRLGISRQRANRRRNSQEVQEIINETFEFSKLDARRIFHKAMKVLEASLDDSSPKIRFAAAKHLTQLSKDNFSKELTDNQGDESEVVFVAEFT